MRGIKSKRCGDKVGDVCAQSHYCIYTNALTFVYEIVIQNKITDYEELKK